VSSVGSNTFTSSGAAGAPGAAAGGVSPASSATFTGGTGAASAAGGLDSSLDLPDQPAPPQVSAETQVSQAAGEQGNTVPHGGGTGIVEGEVGNAGSGLEQEAVASARGGQSDVRGAKLSAGEAQFSAATAPTSGLERAENLEFSQRDQVMARSQSAENAQSEARRAVDDPTAVGTERAEQAASQRAAESMPVDARDAEAKANVVTGAVADPQGAARAQAQGAAAAQEREAEVKLGIRGPEGQSREEIVGSPATGDDEKK
jgi:hypothetical protein